jgi:hypothetical protein
MMPIEPERREMAESRLEAAGPIEVRRPSYPWYRKLAAVLLVVACLAIGLFLMIFPWTDYWDENYFGATLNLLRHYWSNMYVRGAVSGLGAIDVYISLIEVFRLRRFANR